MAKSRGLGMGGRAAIAAVLGVALFGWFLARPQPAAPPAISADGRPGKPGKQHVAKKKAHGAKPRGPKLAGPFGSLAACEKHVRARTPRPASAPPRLGTWNIRWFPYGASNHAIKDKVTNIDWLACAIASLDVDALAMQEIIQDSKGRAALLDLQAKLDALTGATWKGETDDCTGGGRQHVGLLFDESRVVVSDLRKIDSLNPAAVACANNLRPGFGARLKYKNGTDLQLVAVHLDSGDLTRDYDNRRASLAALGGVVASAKRGQGVIVLGDFNTMGCKECQPAVSGGDEIALLDGELEGAGLVRVRPPEGPLCSHYYKGKPQLLDHVLVSTKPRDLASVATLEVAGACSVLACKAPKRGTKPEAFDRLSDHCPLVVELGATTAAAAPKGGAPPAPKATRSDAVKPAKMVAATKPVPAASGAAPKQAATPP